MLGYKWLRWKSLKKCYLKNLAFKKILAMSKLHVSSYWYC